MKRNYFLPVLLLVLTLAASLPGLAQVNIEFTYDDSGNRETRTVITLKSASIHRGSGDSEQEEELLEDQVGLQKTLIYPNPTKGLLWVDFPSLTSQEANIRVYDSNGKLIIQQTASLSNRLDLSAYPSGFYVMIIRVGEEKKEWKIIKE